MIQKDHAIVVNMEKYRQADAGSHNRCRHREFRDQAFPGGQKRQCQDAKGQRNSVYVDHGLCQMAEQFGQLACSGRSTQQFRDLHQDDRHGDPADKSSHDRRRDKVYDPVRVKEIEQQKP